MRYGNYRTEVSDWYNTPSKSHEHLLSVIV